MSSIFELIQRQSTTNVPNFNKLNTDLLFSRWKMSEREKTYRNFSVEVVKLFNSSPLKITGHSNGDLNLIHGNNVLNHVNLNFSIKK
jgi:hypothetical protein